jgi:ribonuclease P protein component
VARFPRRARLLKPAEFERVFKNGRRETVTNFIAVAALSDEGPRLGLAISRKQAALAVDRNRIKRQIRASFREAQGRLPACDLVIMAKPQAKNLDSAAAVADLNKLWNRVIQRWSASSLS